ncbi:MAG: Smr/MutS family protein [Acidobacteria bacterium]|nr:Smr/MutS family protein [Acidobacteriota bacterium]
MRASALRALEFDRIVTVVAGLAVTPPGRERLAALRPLTSVSDVAAAQRATSEGTRFLADHPGFPLRAPDDLEEILAALGVDGRALEPLRLLALADYLESIEQSRAAVLGRGDVYVAPTAFPILRGLVEAVSSFAGERADVRRKIDPSGDIVDHASPALGQIRGRLRKQRARLRATLEGYLRGRDTAKYLQEQVVTDRNGRYVLVVRSEHRSAIPGIVHGGSASGASLFVEPLDTVEINNDIVSLQDEEAEEVHRILLALTDAFRGRSSDLRRTVDIATALDVIQARARFSQIVDGIEPAFASDGTVELRGARHPLLMRRVRERLDDVGAASSGRPGEPDPAAPTAPAPWGGVARPTGEGPVPVDVLLIPPIRVLVIAGPNTGGKTVALKTAGLLVAMAQAGLHIPVAQGSRLPVFRSLFADIGDEQSIAASLSTFSAHITNVVAMDRDLALPALVLLDEVGAGTDPIEGGALGTAIVEHFRRRSAHVVVTTHHDSLKSYASTTEGVVGAAFGFDPVTFAPTYRLAYGSPGRSLAIEIAARLGMPASVVDAARANLSEPEKQLAEHLARVDEDLRRLEQERRLVARERSQVEESERKLRAREQSVREREERVRARFDAKLDDRIREARREIDTVIEGLKARAAMLSEQAAVRLKSGETLRVAGLSTGETGAARAEARQALDAIVDKLKAGRAGEAGKVGEEGFSPPAPLAALALPALGVRVAVGALGLEGVVVDVHGKHAEVDVRGKRLRAALRDLRVLDAGAPHVPAVRVNVDLQPREGSLSELNVIGCTVDDALTRVEKFLDESVVTELGELRIVHGHGTGQLRRAISELLKDHPLVARFEAAPPNQGGGGATIVHLKD